MLRISERFDDFEREFALRDKLIDFDVSGPVEITPPDAIYSSPGGAISEAFKEPPAVASIPLPPYVTYISGPPARRVFPPRSIKTEGQVSAPGKNFLDIFFDWLNKILSGK